MEDAPPSALPGPYEAQRERDLDAVRALYGRECVDALLDSAMGEAEELVRLHRAGEISEQDVSDRMQALVTRLRLGSPVEQAVWVLLFGDDPRWVPERDVEAA
jgi:hypothetical protein